MAYINRQTYCTMYCHPTVCLFIGIFQQQIENDQTCKGPFIKLERVLETVGAVSALVAYIFFLFNHIHLLPVHPLVMISNFARGEWERKKEAEIRLCSLKHSLRFMSDNVIKGSC